MRKDEKINPVFLIFYIILGFIRKNKTCSTSGFPRIGTNCLKCGRLGQ